jgi:hypothetical protein
MKKKLVLNRSVIKDLKLKSGLRTGVSVTTLGGGCNEPTTPPQTITALCASSGVGGSVTGDTVG